MASAAAEPASPGTRRSIAARLRLGLAAVALAIFVLVGSLLLWTLHRELERSEAKEIEGKANVVQHFLDEVHEPSDLQALRQHLDNLRAGNRQLRIWLVADGGAVLYGDGRRPQTLPRRDGGLTAWREDGVPLAGKAFRLVGNGPVPEAQLLIAMDARERMELLSSYRNALLLICSLGWAATVGLGEWVTRRELRPVRQLSREAAAIAPDALSVRLSVAGTAEELRALVDSFNRALDRVQAAYEHLEAFSADVAHELRTPLATMISGTEVALACSRSAEEMTETLASNLEELRQLAAMVNDMLFLAEADRGGSVDTLEPLDLAQHALQVVEYFEATLEECRQTIQVRGRASALANPALLRRALVNLVSNAIRYTDAGGQITIKVSSSASEARVAVCNPGPEIEAASLPRLFDRFFRADPARQRGGERHGLGLAIVRAVARMHGGETVAISSGGITEVGFTLRATNGSEARSRR